MASIAISNILPVGHDLLSDSENFMTDLNENELERVVGGTEPVTAAIAVSIGVAAAGAFLTGLYFGLK